MANNPEISAIGGLVLPAQLGTLPQLWFEEYFGGFSQSFDLKIVNSNDHPNDALFPYAPGAYVAGCNMAFRKTVLQARSGFRFALGPGTPTLGGEDLECLSLCIKRRHGCFRTRGTYPAFASTNRRGISASGQRVRGRTRPRCTSRSSFTIRGTWCACSVTRGKDTHSLKRSRTQRSPSVETSFPEITSRVEKRGMLYGPMAYLTSWKTFHFAKVRIVEQFGDSIRM